MGKDTKNAELVFIPTPGAGHLTSTIEVAKLITDLDSRFSATILIMRLPGESKKPVPDFGNPRLRFLELRKEENQPSPEGPHFVKMFQIIEDHKPHVREVLAGISSSGSSRLAGIVIDMFCTSVMEVAKEIGVPSYLFFTTGAGILGQFFYLQSLRDDFKVDITKFHNSDEELPIPTYKNPVPAKVLPSGYFEKGGADVFLDLAKMFRETNGIMINTFQELEPHAIQALLEDKNVPPVYPIGPLLNIGVTSKNNESDEIMNFLNHQPDASVIFLCFGSKGSFSDEQVMQIAYALQNSGCRFLWSLRKPAPKDAAGFLPGDYDNLDEVLPEGFLTRTAEVGKVIGWAPQATVLAHPAVGGFVSHCGWNSTLESIWFGVPTASWPQYAEQQTNAFFLVKEAELAVEIKIDYVKSVGTESTEIVSAEVIENGIRKLMADGEENRIRKNVKEMQRKSRMVRDGSSSVSLQRFLDTALDNISS
uniref:Glycosyltransferase n=1 Tax=Rubia yunnanensis TaxID=1650721 RepID=A0A896APW3_9GENT|nr:glycosyltransferase [Rubia yunnanensis]